MALSDFPIQRYGAVRLAWCKAALANLIRRWGVYMVIAAVVLGGTDPQAAAALLLAPLFLSVQQTTIQSLLVCSLYALGGGVLSWLTSPLLWSKTWAEAERVLPLDPAETLRSDIVVVLLGLTPVLLLYLAGTLIWFVKSPAWFEQVWGRCVLLLLAAALADVALGVAMLRYRRRLPKNAASARVFRSVWRRAGIAGQDFPAQSRAKVLLLWPMLHGPARRTGRFLLSTALSLAVCDVALAVDSQHSFWWLAAFAVLAQAQTSRLMVLVNAELGALHQACTVLPLGVRWTTVARYVVAMLPLGAAWLLLVAVLSVRAAFPQISLMLYLAVQIAGNLILIVALSSRAFAAQSSTAAKLAIWWLLILVLSLALASEVLI
jgi:hypothetical protein